MPEVIANADFSNGLSGWTGLDGSTMLSSTVGVPAGAPGAVVWRASTKNGLTGHQSITNFTAGKSYTLRGVFAFDPAALAAHPTWVWRRILEVDWYSALGILISTSAPISALPDPSGQGDQFTPAPGWNDLIFTITPPAGATSAGITFEFFGEATRNANLSAGWEAPWVGLISLSSPSHGTRLFPASPTVGQGAGTIASGSDTRFPRTDSSGLLAPRTERIDISVPGALFVGSDSAKILLPHAGRIRKIAFTIGDIVSGGSMGVDVTVGRATVLGAVIFLNSSLMTRVLNASFPITGGEFLSLDVTSIPSVGTASDLTVTTWVSIE